MAQMAYQSRGLLKIYRQQPRRRGILPLQGGPKSVSYSPMLRLRPWIHTPLLFACSGLMAQEARVPGPDEVEPIQNVENVEAVPGPDEVERIERVGAPKIPTGAGAADGLGMPDHLTIDNDGGEIVGNVETGITFSGPVKITGDNGLEAFAKKATLDLKKKTVVLEGDVSIYQGDVLNRGERAVYHYDEKRMDTDGMRASYDPLILEAGKFNWHRKGDRSVLIGKNAGITTHDFEDPGYWIRADETRIYPDEKITFKNMKFCVGDTPVFWLPYLSQPLHSELGYHFIPGAQSAWGPYLLNTYGVMLGGNDPADTGVGSYEEPWLLSRWHFDILTRRGVGLGLDLADIHSDRNDEITGLSLYWLNDQDPGFSRSGLPRTLDKENRYKLQLRHRMQFEDWEKGADWRLDTNLNYYSDRHYLEDFEDDIYSRDPSPDNMIGLFRRTDSTLLSIVTRYQVNDFYRADSRLPEVSLDMARKPLFDSPVLHEGSFSLGWLGERSSDLTKSTIIDPLSGLTLGDPGTADLLSDLTGFERLLAEEMVSLPLGDPRRQQLRHQLNNSGFGRFHTYHQFSAPLTFANAINITPRIGGGYTRYMGLDSNINDFGRPIFHMGVEASMKFTRDLNNYRNKALGIDGLLHVFQPYVAWSYTDTDDYSIGDPAVDRLIPSTRPRPLDPVRYTAIDEYYSWNVVRLGMRNRLITRRDEQSHEWLYLDTYIDAFAEDPEGDRGWSNVYNDLLWDPVPWMQAAIETQFPLGEGSGFTELAARTRFMPTDNFEFTLGYRWLNGHPFLQDSSRIRLDTYSRINQDWGFGTRHTYEMDDGVLEDQRYTIHRDLGQWTAGVGLTSRDSRLNEEYGILFFITLKDFPSASLPFEFGAGGE